MDFLIILICYWSVGYLLGGAEGGPGGRVIGGRDAGDGEFPYQVEIFRQINNGEDLFPVCGGSLVDARHVLTAGHCLYAQIIPKLVIAAGVTNISDPNRINMVAEEGYIHEQYDDKYLYNDIAIVRVEGEFPMGAFLQPVPLRTEPLPASTSCVITGWGNMGMWPFPSEYPEVLQALEVPLLDNELCRELYADYDVIEGMMCAGYVEGFQDSCDGDSGSALVCGGEQAGVVSWGDLCAQPGSPGVYADVAFYAPWIQRTLAASWATVTALP